MLTEHPLFSNSPQKASDFEAEQVNLFGDELIRWDTV